MGWIIKKKKKNMINYNIYRGSHVSLSWFSCASFILVELEFGVVVFGKKRALSPVCHLFSPPLLSQALYDKNFASCHKKKEATITTTPN